MKKNHFLGQIRIGKTEKFAMIVPSFLALPSALCVEGWVKSFCR
jgi:hypothetical protein